MESKGKTVLITGASTGFGLAIAQKLHADGFNVIGTSRNPAKTQSEVPFKMLALDIAEDTSISSFSQKLFTEIGRLDVLINNAGFLVTGLAEETPIELGRQQFETNFWGTIKLTNELLPQFRKQREGKIITIGSVLGLVSLPNVAYYAASKHALEGYYKALRLELTQFNIQVCMVEPMGFKTNIATSSTTVPGKFSDYDTFRKQITAFTKNEFDKAPEAGPVIEAVIKLVKEKNSKYSNPIGKGSTLFPALQFFMQGTLESQILKQVNAVK